MNVVVMVPVNVNVWAFSAARILTGPLNVLAAVVEVVVKVVNCPVEDDVSGAVAFRVNGPAKIFVLDVEVKLQYVPETYVPA